MGGATGSVWRFTMLGGWQVRRGDEALERFRTRKTASLLAYLACFPQRAHQREELAERFWPDAEPEFALRSLSVALWSLRRVLEPPDVAEGSVLIAERLTARLNPKAIATDIGGFQEALADAKRAATPDARRRCLEAAADLYAGDLLPGFYDDWVITERERLGQEYARAVDALLPLLEEAGDRSEVVPYLLRRVQADPYDEAACRRLMRAYADAGQSHAALRHFDELTRLLENDLDPETQAVAAAIRAGTPSPGRLPPARAPVAPGVPSSPARAPLPLIMTRFFGREAEVERVIAWLTAPPRRLVTLTGPGGSGKTRLSLEVARGFGDVCADRIVHLALADIADPARVVGALGNTLRLPAQEGTIPREYVAAALASTPTLLILDNLEHLIGESAHLDDLILYLLERAPTLRILATSRQRLGVPGEQELPVLPLPIPLLPGTPDRLLEFASVQLLVDRARLKQPDFQVTPRNADAVAKLCHLLDGIPLALELAASWLRVLPPSAMRARLEAGELEALVSRQHNVPERHQTIFAAVEWSYRLLSPDVQTFLRRLSVFRGGWTEEGARRVCQEPRALEFLEQLSERSLVETQDTGETPRYRMLETVRHFAVSRLAESGDTDAARRRHCRYLIELSEQAERNWIGPEEQTWHAILTAELENLRAALTWCLSPDAPADDRIPLGLDLAGCLWRFWHQGGRANEGRETLEQLLSRADPSARTRSRARALLSLGWLYRFQDFSAAREALDDSLSLSRELGDESTASNALLSLGFLDMEQGDYGSARRRYDECLALRRAIGRPEGVAEVRKQIAELAVHSNRVAEAEGLFLELLSFARRTGSETLTENTLGWLGTMARERGAHDAAHRYLTEALNSARRRGDPWEICATICELAQSCSAAGDARRTEALLEEALALTRENGMSPDEYHCVSGHHFLDQGDYAKARFHYERVIAERRERAWQSGLPIAHLEAAIASLLQGDRVAAASHAGEAHRLSGEAQDTALQLACLETIAALEVAGGPARADRGARLFGAAEALRDTLDLASGLYWRRSQRHLMERFRDRLEGAALSEARAGGRSMTLDQAVDLASQAVERP